MAWLEDAAKSAGKPWVQQGSQVAQAGAQTAAAAHVLAAPGAADTVPAVVVADPVSGAVVADPVSAAVAADTVQAAVAADTGYCSGSCCC